MDIVENRMRFSFQEPAWKVIKYDGEACYRNGLEKLKPSKAVDFIARHSQYGLFLIEVKDFRGHRIENRERIESGDLAKEIGLKVRDTVAGVVGTYRNPAHQEMIKTFLKTMVSLDEAVYVVLWLETDIGLETDIARSLPQRRAARASILANELKKRNRWLTSKVFVTNHRANVLDGVTVRFLP